MREILFRGKRIDNGEWVEGFLICLLHNKSRTYIGALFADDDHDTDLAEVDPATVGQYIDLIDKNDVKIFEGDIILVDRWDDKYVVKFSVERFGFFPFACGDGCGCCENNTIYPKSDPVEVIGNIYDNPELIEGAIQ